MSWTKVPENSATAMLVECWDSVGIAFAISVQGLLNPYFWNSDYTIMDLEASKAQNGALASCVHIPTTKCNSGVIEFTSYILSAFLLFLLYREHSIRKGDLHLTSFSLGERFRWLRLTFQCVISEIDSTLKTCSKPRRPPTLAKCRSKPWVTFNFGRGASHFFSASRVADGVLKGGNELPSRNPSGGLPTLS